MTEEQLLSQWQHHPSQILAAECRLHIGSEDHGTVTSAFHSRGSREELEIGIEYCRSSDPLDRCTGLMLLGGLGYEHGVLAFRQETLPIVLSLLRDDDLRVVKWSLKALWWLSDPATVPEIEPFLSHPDPAIRLAAVVAFNEILELDYGPLWEFWMLKLATDADWKVREWAIQSLILSELGSPAIRQALIGVLMGPDEEERQALIQVWESTSCEPIRQRIEGILKDPNADDIVQRLERVLWGAPV